jgi:enamine deaminase RidA (YjgF/YER057c/UK114 family)
MYMPNIEDKIKELGLFLPDLPKPLASYIPAKKVGNILFTSGQLPLVKGELVCTGLLGVNVDVETAKNAAKICTLNALAAIKGLIGDLDQIEQVLRLVGYVASDQNFHNQPAVVNGASDFLLELFGDRGKHARSAIGVSSLPLNSPVEIELTIELK